MKNVQFNVCGTRTQQFTSSQETKVRKGIEIFQRVVNSPAFKNRVCNYSWTSSNGKTFQRFHMSHGLSNTQVWDCLCNGNVSWNNQYSQQQTFNVVPCATNTDWNNCMTNPSSWVCPTPTSDTATMTMTCPCLCVNVNCLNDKNYTAVHVAAALMYEYCVCCGFTTEWNGNTVRNWQNTVPAVCSWMVADCCKEVCATDTTVMECMECVNLNDFDCCACSTTFFTNRTTATWNTSVSQLDVVISSLEREWNCLNAVTNKTSEEVDRFTCVTNCLDEMRTMRTNLCRTSLDGCDMVGTTVYQWNRVAQSN